ncbi:DUF605-domain-containing protein [Calocera cornea HHB12733]|uniref:DUF605-domain-containing protein n=1 Tax=Calocera cornea HHB12733 TaxID=1353952 RepID=A0A165DKY3_9BASI|nr:DUF605-domain-containing protein [Calocera cornea HHB12733]
MPPKQVVLPANLPSSAACPPSLKAIAPYLQRAAEVKTADPVVAYWCLYNAARLGLPLAKGHDQDAKRYIEQILMYLEASKGTLQGEKAISDTDMACQRIEAFASRIFGNADNEDRMGAATKLTAKKFLAAANFMQLLSIFDREGDVADKIKYAKWKASDIAKALREGRVPLAGPAGGIDSPLSEDPFATGGAFPDTTALPHPDTFTSGTISPPRAGTIPHTPSAWSTVATPGPDYTDERKREASHWPQESPTPGAGGRPGGLMDDSSAGNAGDDEGGESDGGYWSTASTPGTAFVDGKHLFAAQQQRAPPPSIPPPPAQSSYGSNASGSSGHSSNSRPSDPSVRRVRFTESTAGGSEDLNEPAPMSPIHELQEMHPDESDLRTPTATNGGGAPRRLSQDQAPRPTIVVPPDMPRRGGPMEGLPSVIDDEPGAPLPDNGPRRSSNSPPKNGSTPLRPSVTISGSGHTPTSSMDTPSSSRDSSRVLPPTVPIASRERRPSQDRQERGPPTIDTNLHTRSRSNSGSTPAGPPSGLTPSGRDRKDNGGPPTIQSQGRERRNSLTNGRPPVTPETGPPTATPTGTRDRRNSLTRRDGPPTVILPTAGRDRRGSGSGDTPDRSYLAPPSATTPRPSQSLSGSPSRSAQVPLPDSATSSANASPDLGHHVKALPGYSAPSKQTPVTPSAPAWNTPISARPSAPPAPSVPAPPPAKEYDFRAMNEAKRHANFAISALNFEDVVTARKELLLALSAIGG